MHHLHLNKEKQTMRKSYVLESSLQICMLIELKELDEILALIEPLTNGENGDWKARDVLEKLSGLRRDSVAEAKREFDKLANKQ
jgi:hypothetical protein